MNTLSALNHTEYESWAELVLDSHGVSIRYALSCYSAVPFWSFLFNFIILSCSTVQLLECVNWLRWLVAKPRAAAVAVLFFDFSVCLCVFFLLKCTFFIVFILQHYYEINFIFLPNLSSCEGIKYLRSSYGFTLKRYTEKLTQLFFFFFFSF